MDAFTRLALASPRLVRLVAKFIYKNMRDEDSKKKDEQKPVEFSHSVYGLPFAFPVHQDPCPKKISAIKRGSDVMK